MMSSRLERLKELLKQSPGDAFIRFAIAKELEKSGKLNEAVEMLRSVVSDSPEYVGAYYHLAALLARCDDVKEALKIYDKGIAVAREQGDDHALAELRNARMNLELEMP